MCLESADFQPPSSGLAAVGLRAIGQGGNPLAGTAIITSTASDVSAELAASRGITVVPSLVSFGDEEYRAGVDLSVTEFWERMTAPSAPFPGTSPPSPGSFRDAYASAFEAGADAIVSVQMSARMSATLDSARVAAEMFPDQEIHVIDTGSTSMATGLLAMIGADMATLGVSAAEIARVLLSRSRSVRLFAALDTLEYLRKGGRISGAAARIGGALSVKPIITIEDGQVEVIDRATSRRAARARVVELLAAQPAEWLAIMYSPPADGHTFRTDVVERIPGGIDPQHVIVYPVGLTIGPHVGPGCLGGVVLPATTV